MATDVLMPAMGYDMTEGTIVRWLKQPGDAVQRGEPLAEIETDKAVVEIEAFAEGTLAQIVVVEGEVVPVGAVIAVIAAAGEALAASAPPASAPPTPAAAGEAIAASAPPAAAPPSPPPVPAASPAVADAPQPVAVAATRPIDAPLAGNGRIRVSPVASRIAAEHGLDLHTIRGTGPDSRILRRDVEAALAGAPAVVAAAVPVAIPPVTPPAPVAVPSVAPTGLPQSLPDTDQIFQPAKLRATMARRMAQSKEDAPHYYLTTDVDMTEAQALRKQVNDSAKGEYKISVNDQVVRATILAIAKHPLFNATFTRDGRIQLNARINMGLAVALPEGLIAPCVLDVRSKSLIQLAPEVRALAERARANRLHPDEYSAGTFTISNLGMFGVDILVAIINPPQTAILGVGRVAEKPVVRDGQVVIRDVMTMALSADHRVTTGAEGAEFLRSIRENLESPVRLLL